MLVPPTGADITTPDLPSTRKRTKRRASRATYRVTKNPPSGSRSFSMPYLGLSMEKCKTAVTTVCQADTVLSNCSRTSCERQVRNWLVIAKRLNAAAWEWMSLTIFCTAASRLMGSLDPYMVIGMRFMCPVLSFCFLCSALTVYRWKGTSLGVNLTSSFFRGKSYEFFL